MRLGGIGTQVNNETQSVQAVFSAPWTAHEEQRFSSLAKRPQVINEAFEKDLY